MVEESIGVMKHHVPRVNRKTNSNENIKTQSAGTIYHALIIDLISTLKNIIFQIILYFHTD